MWQWSNQQLQWVAAPCDEPGTLRLIARGAANELWLPPPVIDCTTLLVCPKSAWSRPWLPDGYSRIFRILGVLPFGLLDYGSATLRYKIWSLPFLGLRPHALHPGAIQGKEGIKFCHLATMIASITTAIDLRSPPPCRANRARCEWFIHEPPPRQRNQTGSRLLPLRGRSNSYRDHSSASVSHFSGIFWRKSLLYSTGRLRNARGVPPEQMQ